MTLFDDVFSGPQGVAKSLITKFGTPVTLRREAKTYDVATGKNTVSSTDYSVKMTPPQPYRKARKGDAVVEVGDITAMIAADGLVIVPNVTTDKVVYGGNVWQIVTVDPVVSGDSTAAYQLRLRQ